MEIERKFWIDRLPDLPEVRHSEIEQAICAQLRWSCASEEGGSWTQAR